MSKAFTKDDAWEETVVVPPRAPLPEGVPNYVTPRGLELLRAELVELEAERARLIAELTDEAERRHRRDIVSRRLADLSARIASAAVVDPRAQSHEQVRFGATVTVRTLEGEKPGDARSFTIVGVDEADAAQGRIAFTAPIARALLGLEEGETASLRTARGDELLQVTSIHYD